MIAILSITTARVARKYGVLPRPLRALLRALIKPAFTRAASSGYKCWLRINHTTDRTDEQNTKLDETNALRGEITRNCKIDERSVSDLELDLVLRKESIGNTDAINISYARRYSAYIETIYFLSVITSNVYPNIPKPKTKDELTTLAINICDAFYMIITSPENGQVPATKSAAAQNTIIMALMELKKSNGNGTRTGNGATQRPIGTIS